MKRFVIAGAVALWAVAWAASSPAEVMMGAHVGTPQDPDWQAEFVGLETSIGRPLAIDSDYADWAAFPDSPRIRWDIQTGHLPMQSWRVLFQDTDPNSCATAAAINAGTYDTQLGRQAAELKAFGAPILVRFNYEMTDNQENTCFTGFPILQNMALAGQEFILAWRHVVGRFRAVGATNVKWVWAPGGDAYVKNYWQLFYPGDAYVDWIAIDEYNMVDALASFATDPNILQFYAAMSSNGKPLMISENGALEDSTLDPDPQTYWLNTAHTYLKAHPAITAFVYWDNDQTPPPPPYQGSGYVLEGLGLAAFKAMANDPYFN